MSDTILVGRTGFVGSNLARAKTFGQELHSTDVMNAFDKDNGLLIYAGVPAAMFLANSDPSADLDIMRTARENIRRINADRTVLISTISVYEDSRGKNESDEPATQGLNTYGSNRLQLEQWVREDYPDALIVRLPALYGEGLKKNFLYDLIHIAPSLLKPEAYERLSQASDLVSQSYVEGPKGFMALSTNADRASLRDWFARNDFNALCFTDSRSRYQFYDLHDLMADIDLALNESIDTLNISTPPVSAAEVHEYVTGTPWTNELEGVPFDYDMRTLHSKRYGRTDGYICSKEDELKGIKQFVEDQRERL